MSRGLGDVYKRQRVSGEELKRIERYLERLKNMKDIGI